MSAPLLLLRNAELMLDGKLAAEGQSSRLAAFLARQALEMLVTQRCAALNAECGSATMASKLVVLRVLDDPDVADAAAIAWNRLSSACHHHAYELSPTVDEVRYLCELVASLIA